MKNSLSDWLDEYAIRQAQRYVARYEREAGYSTDPKLAAWIEREVMRRATMGRWLDLYEPAIWQTAAVAAAAGIAVMQKSISTKDVKSVDLRLAAGFAALGSSVNFARLWFRYNAGLQGGMIPPLSCKNLNMRKSSMQRRRYIPYRILK